MTYRRAADDFLNDQEWTLERPPTECRCLDSRISGDTEERLVIDVPGGPYEISYRAFNLLTLAAHDFHPVIRFFAKEWPDAWDSFGPTSLPVENWRNPALEQLIGEKPILTREGMNYLASFWHTRENSVYNHPSRQWVRPHAESILHNHGLFHNLEIGPVFPGHQVVYRGWGDPVRLVPTE